MIYVTSDLCIGRDSLARERGFSDAREMSETIISNWNSIVKPEDTVYHLGNLCWDPIETDYVVERLNGIIVFGVGSNDSILNQLTAVKSGKCSISDKPVCVLRTLNRKKNVDFIASYWAHLDWPGRKEGIIHIHGGDIATDLSVSNRFLVNCDKFNMRPIDIDTILDIVELFHEDKKS